MCVSRTYYGLIPPIEKTSEGMRDAYGYSVSRRGLFEVKPDAVSQVSRNNDLEGSAKVSGVQICVGRAETRQSTFDTGCDPDMTRTGAYSSMVRADRS